jgi:uncharacterized membrane protein
MDERFDAPGRTPESADETLTDTRRTDYRMDLLISYVLRGGVTLSAGLLILGALLYYAHTFSSGTPAHPPPFPHTLAGVFHGLAQGDPLAILSLGLLVLLLTPVARVVVSILAFARERDWLYVAITTLVLLILLVSFLLGRGGA